MREGNEERKMMKNGHLKEAKRIFRFAREETQEAKRTNEGIVDFQDIEEKLEDLEELIKRAEEGQ